MTRNFNEITGKFCSIRYIIINFSKAFLNFLHREGRHARIGTRGNARQYGTLKQKSHLDGQGGTFFTRLIPNISVNIDLFLRKSSLRLWPQDSFSFVQRWIWKDNTILLNGSLNVSKYFEILENCFVCIIRFII